jgi:hypothetical protein
MSDDARQSDVSPQMRALLAQRDETYDPPATEERLEKLRRAYEARNAFRLPPGLRRGRP